MIRIKKRYLLFIILIIVLLSGIFTYNYILENQKFDMIYSYDFNINTSNTTVYNLYLPTPITTENQIPEWINNSQILGINSTITFVESIYGTALNVSGQGNFRFHAKKIVESQTRPKMDIRNRHPYNDIDFNLWVDNNTTNRGLGFIWVYANFSSNNNPLTIYINLHIVNIDHSTRGTILLTEGWNKVEIIGGGKAM